MRLGARSVKAKFPNKMETWIVGIAYPISAHSVSLAQQPCHSMELQATKELESSCSFLKSPKKQSQ